MWPVLYKAFTCGAPVGPLATSKMCGTARYLDRSVAKGNRDLMRLSEMLGTGPRSAPVISIKGRTYPPWVTSYSSRLPGSGR